MSVCYIVVHRNYDEGLSANAYTDRESANLSVRQDVDMVYQSLVYQGYSDAARKIDHNHQEVVAARGNIYFEWTVIESTIE